MTAGDSDVQIATTGTAARLTISQLNNGAIVVVANLIA